jgi:hypothetical protein
VESGALPPWVYPVRFEDPDDEAVVAGIIAVHLIAPNAVSEPQPWLIRGVLRAQDAGPLQLARVAVEHFLDPSAEVTSTVIRGVPTARLRDFANSYLAVAPGVLAEEGVPSDAERRWATRVTRAAAKRPLRRGRGGYSVDHYRRIALLALEIHDKGHHDVVKELAAREDRPYQTVRDWVRRARELGFLKPAQRGRSQWVAGPKLYRKEE